MNIVEHLLLCLAEEAGEVAQAAGKAGRFGMYDAPPSGGLQNNEYIVCEVNDVLAILELLQQYGVYLSGVGNRSAINEKKRKVLQFMAYAESRGTLIMGALE